MDACDECAYVHLQLGKAKCMIFAGILNHKGKEITFDSITKELVRDDFFTPQPAKTREKGGFGLLVVYAY